MFSSNKSYQKEKEAFQQFLTTQVAKKRCAGFDRHSVFLTHEGEVYTRGYNHAGQLGLHDTVNRFRHSGSIMPTYVPDLANIIDIEVGTHFTFCLNNQGKVYAFGMNTSGQLGLGDKENKTSPCLIEALNDCTIVAIHTNSCVSYFLDDKGKVYSCGSFNNSASTGLGSSYFQVSLPTQIPNLPAIEKIIPCGDYVFFLTCNHEVYGCGDNVYGQLGVGDYEIRYLPTQLTLPPIKEIKADGNTPLFLTEYGQVYACGKNSKNLFSLSALKGTNDCYHHLIPLTGLDSVTTVEVGYENTIFIVENGDVFVHFKRIGGGYYPNNEKTDFLEYPIPIPHEVMKKLKCYSFFNLPPLRYEKNSDIAKACYAIIDKRDQDWGLRNKLLFKYKHDSHLVAYIKKLSSKKGLNNSPQTFPSLRLLSALSLMSSGNQINTDKIPADINEFIESIAKIQDKIASRKSDFYFSPSK